MQSSALSHFALAFQFGLGIVFFLSVLSKLRQPLTFVQNIIQYDILPAQFAYIFGLLLILLEAFLAITFLTGRLSYLVLPLAMALLIIFLAAVGTNLWRGRKIACSCFGNPSEQISSRTVVRLLLLLATVLLLMVLKTTTNLVLPELSSMATEKLFFTEFLPTLFLAIFFIVLGAWTLSLPELILLIRH